MSRTVAWLSSWPCCKLPNYMYAKKVAYHVSPLVSDPHLLQGRLRTPKCGGAQNGTVFSEGVGPPGSTTESLNFVWEQKCTILTQEVTAKLHNGSNGGGRGYGSKSGGAEPPPSEKWGGSRPSSPHPQPPLYLVLVSRLIPTS